MYKINNKRIEEKTGIEYNLWRSWDNWKLKLEEFFLTEIVLAEKKIKDEILEIIKSNIVEDAEVIIETSEHKFARQLINKKLSDIINLIQSKKEKI